MRHPYFDDLNPGTTRPWYDVATAEKPSWFKRWVVRPLKATFVKAPVWTAKKVWAVCTIVGKGVKKEAVGLWQGARPMLLKLKDFAVGTPLRRFALFCAVCVIGGVWMMWPKLFAAVMWTVGFYAFILALIYVGGVVATSAADAFKHQEEENLRRHAAEARISHHAVSLKVMEEEAKADAAAEIVQEIRQTIKPKLIEKAKTEYYNSLPPTTQMMLNDGVDETLINDINLLIEGGITN